jgi:murein lipoprotein
MIRRDSKIFAPVVAAIAISGLAGCASTADMDSLRSDVDQANQAAESAAAEAAAARREAAAAALAAEEAKAAAEDAKAAAMATDAKIDRMFKKTMYK